LVGARPMGATGLTWREGNGGLVDSARGATNQHDPRPRRQRRLLLRAQRSLQCCSDGMRLDASIRIGSCWPCCLFDAVDAPCSFLLGARRNDAHLVLTESPLLSKRAISRSPPPSVVGGCRGWHGQLLCAVVASDTEQERWRLHQRQAEAQKCPPFVSVQTDVGVCRCGSCG
jgi:hypothetical protein